MPPGGRCYVLAASRANVTLDGSPAAMPDSDKAGLRAALIRRHVWLDEPDIGPRAVAAGECDRCGAEPRLVAPCGPPPAGAGRLSADWALGRGCAAELGVDAWCAGHEAEAERALAWLARLPPEADNAARLWWVATGEVRLDPDMLEDGGPVGALYRALRA